jgi:aminoglycoside phosphotransferase family enzyme/predicted kinase
MQAHGCPAYVEPLRRMLDAAGAGPVTLVETHISCVLLAREVAWKIKKPLKLPFLDYGTVDARRRCCEEEVRLNRRLAPALYLGVSAVTGTPDAPRLDGPGPVQDWVVRMRRFPGGALFGERIADGTLTASDIDRLAALVARFHEEAPVAGDPGFGDPALRRRVALETAEALPPTSGIDDGLRAWMVREADALGPVWSARRARGRVRECHGDLHLDNLLLLDGEVTAFDAIEFDPALRCIDVVDDMAFVAMDLLARGRGDFAWRFVNGWLDATGDHDALRALRFSMVYRALVRARVATLRAGQGVAAARYVRAARQIADAGDARLLITHGLPGSGKTFLSQGLLEAAGAVRFRSDVERKRLFGPGAYGIWHTRNTYARLLALAGMALAAGYPTILDAAYLRRDEREQAAALASALRVPFTILDCRAAAEVLEQRVQARQQRGDDASEADVSVLRRLTAVCEPLTRGEQRHAIVADTAMDAPGVSTLFQAWRRQGEGAAHRPRA